MTRQSPAEERLRAGKRARVIIWIALAAFAFVGVMGVIAVLSSPAVWWEWLIVFAMSGFLAMRNVQRLRAINRALPAVEDEVLHQAQASSAIPGSK